MLWKRPAMTTYDFEDITLTRPDGTATTIFNPVAWHEVDGHRIKRVSNDISFTSREEGEAYLRGLDRK